MDNKELEQTLVLIKPDALKNSLTGYVLSLLSEFHTGLRFAGSKIVHVSKMLAEEHYAEHKGKVFYLPLLDYIMGKLHYVDDSWKQRVIALAYQGPDAVKKIRAIAGPTNPHNARDEKPGCIRALGTVVPLKDSQDNIVGERMDNLIHASATTEEAEREIKIWFKPQDIPPAMRPYDTDRCEEFFYYKKDKLFTSHEQDSYCIMAPGDIAWKSDLEILRSINKGLEASDTIEAVVAKYLINDDVDDN